MSKQNSSGCLRFENSDIVYSSEEKELWRLPLAKLRAIGEYTTSEGPYLDDYFIVFVSDKADFCTASFYADGRIPFLLTLSEKIGDKINLGLSNSANWKTRGVWPKAIEGQEFLHRIPEPKAKNLKGKLRQFLHPRASLKLTQPVIEIINQK